MPPGLRISSTPPRLPTKNTDRNQQPKETAKLNQPNTMLNAIRPILATEVPCLPWKLDPGTTPYENLLKLLTITKTIRTTIEDNTLPVEEHLELRACYKTLLAETAQSLESLEALENHIDSSQTQADAEKIQAESHLQANRTFLLLQTEAQQLRKQSTEFGAAWTEIEAQYQLKVTLSHFRNALHSLSQNERPAG